LRVLVTGATGFVGRHLCEFLNKQKNAEVYGTDLIDHEIEAEFPIKLIECDLMNKDAVESCIKEVKPDLVFHLAAIASVPDAWKNPGKVLVNNTVCQLNILEVLAKNDLRPRVLIVSTGEVYGAVDKNDLPIDELTRLRPNNPYAVSKVSQEFLGYQYFESFRIPVIISRSFNHAGPGQRGDFVVPSFVSQVVDIEHDSKDPIMLVGNLEAQRDFLDVRDVVRAYWDLITNGIPGEVYNVCSGKAVRIKRILEILLNNAKTNIKVKQDPDKMRPSDTPVIIGNNAKLKAISKWEPKIPIEQTIIDTLEKMRLNRKSREKVT